ncbi:MAG: pyruvate ferredoxin oxidoreductase, partial [Nitrososphaeria archaeon]
GKIWRGKGERRKNMPLIMSMHRIPYIATGAPSHTNDIKVKMSKAKDTVLNQKGIAYLHLLQPCPTGWYFETSKSIEVSRLAVLTGIWPLYEIENGKLRITYKPSKLKPVKEYLSIQGRYKHLTNNEIDMIQNDVNKYWKMLIELEKLDKLPWYL